MNVVTKEEKFYRNKIRSENLRNDQIRLKNQYELKFIGILIAKKIDYIWQKPFYNHEKYFCVDFYLPGKRIVVEIDGQFHKKNKDLQRTRYLKENFNIKQVVRINNSDLNKNYYKIIEFIGDVFYGNKKQYLKKI